VLKTQLDKYTEEYETVDFIKDDPVQFIHRFKNKDDIEIAGFIASMFAYGKREVFIEKLNYIFSLMNNKPAEYIRSFDYKNNNIKNCDYRFSKDCDLIQILKILHELYVKDGKTLGDLFEYAYNQKKDIWHMFQVVIDYFYSRVDLTVTKGFYHLLPNPEKKSALKRMNMMLRWFVRKSPVDIGIWTFIPKSELLIPLDTHVAKISRLLGLLKRKDNGYESVMEITKNLKQYDSKDPIKYDFALFGYGVNNKV
jgi:uncharacterized protein (TIGR02757 family)